MVYADSLDFYEVRRMGALTGEGMKTLSRCYLPLIGAEALGVYFALYWDLTCLNESTVEAHESFFRRTLVTSAVFERSMNSLEAIGLIRTFLRKGDSPYFVYCVYPPRESYAFIHDPLVAPQLKRTIGDEAFKRLSLTIKNSVLPEGMVEKTQDFSSHFMPSSDTKIVVEREDGSLEKGDIRLEFSQALFDEEFKGYGTNPKLLSDGEKNYIAKLATLYELNEVTAASYVYNCFDPSKGQGKRLDQEQLRNSFVEATRFSYQRKDKMGEQIRAMIGDYKLAEMIHLMDTTSPYRYLTYLHDNNRPPNADLRLIEKLNLELGLTFPCINALIAYVLQKKQNTLPGAYCEKIAGSLIREGCITARDAVDYLAVVDEQQKKGRDQSARKKVQKSHKNLEIKEEVSDEVIRERFGLKRKNDGGSNGKA